MLTATGPNCRKRGSSSHKNSFNSWQLRYGGWASRSTGSVDYELGITTLPARTNTEPGANRGPRAGSPRGVVDATIPGVLVGRQYFFVSLQLIFERVSNLWRRYRSRF